MADSTTATVITRNFPVDFPGTKAERQENYLTHAWSWDDEGSRCMACDAAGWHVAAGWPCGHDVPRQAPGDAPYTVRTIQVQAWGVRMEFGPTGGVVFSFRTMAQALRSLTEQRATMAELGAGQVTLELVVQLTGHGWSAAGDWLTWARVGDRMMDDGSGWWTTLPVGKRWARSSW